MHKRFHTAKSRAGHSAKAWIDAGRINRLRPKAIGKEGHIAEADGMYSKSKARSAWGTTWPTEGDGK